MIKDWSHYFYYILNSILINYKSWIFLAISLLILCEFNVTIFLTFTIGMFSSHLIHYWHHFEYSYPHNIIHDYHHRYNLLFNHFIQVVLEFVSIVGIIPFKYSFIDMVPFLSFIDDWIVIYYYFFYTTIHNINYTVFHVNHVHEIHHEVFLKNMGPDICDIIFGTKYKPEETLENTDHYIPNIIICTLLVLVLKSIWKNSTEPFQKWYLFLSKGLFYSSILFLFVTSICLYKMDIDHTFEKDVDKIKECFKAKATD